MIRYEKRAEKKYRVTLPDGKTFEWVGVSDYSVRLLLQQDCGMTRYEIASCEIKEIPFPKKSRKRAKK